MYSRGTTVSLPRKLMTHLKTATDGSLLRESASQLRRTTAVAAVGDVKSRLRTVHRCRCAARPLCGDGFAEA